MASTTKIINVLKDDSFAEILGLFKSTPAGEVIFVLPKRSKAFQKEEHFAVLREAADEVKKTASFLSSDPKINELAEQHNFEILLARAPSVARSKPTSPHTKRASAVTDLNNARSGVGVNVVNQIESFYEQPQTQAQEEEPEQDNEEMPVAIAASRRMDEVIHTDKEDHHNVKISAGREKSYPVQVRHDVEAENVDDEGIEQVWATPALRSEQAEPIVERVKRWNRPAIPRKKRLAYAFGGVGVILAGIIIYLNTGSAQVVITPAVTQLNFQLVATAGENIASVNASKLTIPGQTLSVQKSLSQTFNATGSKDVAQKARGSLTVYNKTSNTQQLIATTRFQSSDGHIFHTLTSVVVPAAKNVSTPGTVEVQVIADKIGSDYNVPAGTFGIVAFKEKGDTVKYQNITGTSISAMHGGTSGKAIVVTADDFNKAKDLLTAQLKTAINDETKAETVGLKVLNDADVVINTPTSTAAVDDAADTFTMTLTGTLKTAGFKETDLQQLILNYVDKKYNLDVISEKLTVTYSNVQFDTASNTLHMTVTVTGPGYAKVDQQKIITDLLGKGEAQISAYLKALPGITSANVLLSPFWVRSVPRNSAKVHITVTR